MKYPLGRTLRLLGLRAPTTYLQDPIAVFNSALAPVNHFPLLERVFVSLGWLREAPTQTAQVRTRTAAVPTAAVA
jgi:hypothetical protein